MIAWAGVCASNLGKQQSAKAEWLSLQVMIQLGGPMLVVTCIGMAFLRLLLSISAVPSIAEAEQFGTASFLRRFHGFFQSLSGMFGNALVDAFKDMLETGAPKTQI